MRGANVKHNEVEEHKPKTQGALDTPNAAGAPLDTTPDSGGVPRSAPVKSYAVTTSVSGIGTSSVPPSPTLYRSHIAPAFNSNAPAHGRPVRCAFAPHELPSLVEVIFLSQDEGRAIRRLLGDDAQAFVDVMDEARSTSARHRVSVSIDTFC